MQKRVVMEMRISMMMTMILFMLSSSVSAQQESDSNSKSKQTGASLESATQEVYKTVGDIRLSIYRYHPKDHKVTDKRPAIVFFFGGGWKSGDPKQFANQCAYLAERGMVAMTAEYRVSSRHQAKAIDCVEDAKSAIRWVRINAAKLGIDPNRIVAAGGSAGGHLAACTGVIKGYERATDDLTISSIPNAMILFNPALVLDTIEGERGIDKEKSQELRERIGDDPKKVSPYHHVEKGNPPTIIFHGKADSTVPYRTAELFANAMIRHGNRCELVGYEEKGHGFFNYGRDNHSGYRATLDATDRFLVSLGYLPTKPGS